MAHSESVTPAGSPRRCLLGAHAILGALVVLCACSELAPGGDRLPQTVEAVQPDSGPARGARWGCLDAPRSPTASALVPRIDLALSVVDTVTGMPPAGLSARACSRRDVMCDTPLTPDVSPAIDGALHLSVPQQFSDFVEIRSPNTVPTMYFVNRDLMRDTAEAFAIISTLALTGLAAGGNILLDPGLGHALIRTFDCQREPASGVQLSNDQGGLPFVFGDGLPAVGQDVTTPTGVGGFVNVPPGFVVLQGIVRERDTELSNASVIVRPGWFSYGDVEPLTD